MTHDEGMGGTSAYEVCIVRRTRRRAIDEARLRHVIERTLRRHGCSAARLSVALVDDAQIAGVHRQFLGRSGPTDVIAFDLDSVGGAVDGELVLSVETARREARARGHSLEAELALYAVHGTLHLLGFDDGRVADARRMHKEEDRILIELGYGPVFKSADE